MQRNKEITILMGVCGVIMVMGVGICFGASLLAGWAALVMAVLLGVVYGVFTWWRYRELAKLSGYLSRVYAGGKPLDIRDNCEGELSLLKNDLYKVTCVLAHQTERLYEDKNYLADALSNISHQLKTPLTGLFVFNDLLQDEQLPAATRQAFLHECNRQLERIQWLVTSLLTLSRIDAEVIAFKKEKVSLDELLRQSITPFAITLEQKGISVSVDCPEDLCWQGDYNWTLEAISNVLKNATEQVEAGGFIDICAMENPLHIELRIVDSGRGLAAEDIPFLFQRFYKGRDATGGSVGIGLALAKTILQSQNGDIFAANAPDGGAQFTIKLYKQVV